MGTRAQQRARKPPEPGKPAVRSDITAPGCFFFLVCLLRFARTRGETKGLKLQLRTGAGLAGKTSLE